MTNVSPVSNTPDVGHFVALRRALDGQRTAADGIFAQLLPVEPSKSKPGTPATEPVDATLDTHL